LLAVPLRISTPPVNRVSVLNSFVDVLKMLMVFQVFVQPVAPNKITADDP
jgi:hypothetical protein